MGVEGHGLEDGFAGREGTVVEVLGPIDFVGVGGDIVVSENRSV